MMNQVTVHSQSSSVNTQDLLVPGESHLDNDIEEIYHPTERAAQPSSSRQMDLRYERCKSRLTTETYETLFPSKPKTNRFTQGKLDFRVEGIVSTLIGKISQFDSPRTPIGHLLPPTANDCCQTFSTVCAVLLGSCGTLSNLTPLWYPSTINYILYASAWLHQITSSVWGVAKQRPNVRDLTQLLHINEVFPVAPSDDFQVVFYNEAAKVISMVQSLCSRPNRKRRRSEDDIEEICGYLIVSGDYTISISCLKHDTKEDENDAYSLILCDSHGTPVWSKGKASFLVMNVLGGLEKGKSVHLPNQALAYDIETGCEYFCQILFVILEDNRKESWNILQQAMDRNVAINKNCRGKVPSDSRPPPVPYMTWTEVHRNTNIKLSPDDMKSKIDNEWLPLCLEHPNVLAEKNKHFSPESFLRPCFIGTK